MKRIFLFALFIAAVVSLPVTASYALEPGCSQDAWNLLQNQANAMRARNRAYERDIINREESTLALTCFDQAMVLSSRLGFIFSDNIYPNPPPANTLVFNVTAAPPLASPVAYPDWGASGSLAVSLNNVVTPELDNEMKNFLPTWVVPNALTTLVTQLQGAIASVKAAQAAAQAASTAYMALVNQIDTLVKGLPTVALSGLPAQLVQYTALTTALDAMVTSIEATESGAVSGALSQLKSAVMGATMTCTALDDMWNKLNPAYVVTTAGVFYPPESTTYYLLSPYYTLQDVLTPPPTGATPDFTAELQAATDSSVLSTALTDLTTGPFSKPGTSQDWPAPPTFNMTDTATTIINEM